MLRLLVRVSLLGPSTVVSGLVIRTVPVTIMTLKLLMLVLYRSLLKARVWILMVSLRRLLAVMVRVLNLRTRATWRWLIVVLRRRRVVILIRLVRLLVMVRCRPVLICRMKSLFNVVLLLNLVTWRRRCWFVLALIRLRTTKIAAISLLVSRRNRYEFVKHY